MQLKHIVHTIKDAKYYHDMQVIENAMAPAFNAMMRNSNTMPLPALPQPRRVR